MTARLVAFESAEAHYIEALEGEEPIGPVRREDGTWLLDGLMPLDEVADTLELQHLGREEDVDVQTLGGLAMAALGRIPQRATGSPGEVVVSRCWTWTDGGSTRF